MSRAALDAFGQVCVDPLASARQIRAWGGKAVGWIGLDAPLEMFDAAGVLPVRILADAGQPGEGASVYAEGGGHPLLRALVSRLAEGPYADLDAVVIGGAPFTGVSLYQFLCSLDRMGQDRRLPPPTMIDLAHIDSASAHRFNRQGMVRLGQTLGVGDAALADAIAIRNGVRRRLRALEALRYGAAARLTGAEALQVYAAGFSLPPTTYAAMLDALLAALETAAPAPGRPVIVSGSQTSGPALYAALESAGLRVVADDHDFGTRSIGPLTDESAPPLDALAKRYAGRDPAPAQWTIAERVAYLLALVRASGARGVIFDTPAFEHPAAWDYPTLRQALDAAGVSHAVLPPRAYLDPVVVEAAGALAAFV